MTHLLWLRKALLLNHTQKPPNPRARHSLRRPQALRVNRLRIFRHSQIAPRLLLSSPASFRLFPSPLPASFSPTLRPPRRFPLRLPNFRAFRISWPRTFSRSTHFSTPRASP